MRRTLLAALAWLLSALLVLAPVQAFGAEIKSGATADLLTIEPTTKAARVVAWGPDRTGLYVVGDPTGVIATPAANAEVFQFRNSHASRVVYIERITVQLVNAAAVTAAQEFGLRVDPATAWTVAGTGGTAITPTKKLSTFGNSDMTAGDIRVATTAALGAGTKTITANTGLMGCAGPQTNAIGASGFVCEWDALELGEPIFTLRNNEGFVVRNMVAYATGSARVYVTVEWREL